jgi:hypothetical protein
VTGCALFLWINAQTTGSAWTPAYYLIPNVRPGFGAEIGGKGFTPQMAVSVTILRLRSLNEFLFGWPSSSLLFAALYLATVVVRAPVRALAARDARLGAPLSSPAPPVNDRWDRALAVLLAGTIGVYAFWYFPGLGWTLGPRYLYGALPSLVIFTSRGIVWLEELPRRCGAGLLSHVPVLAAVALILFGTIPFLRRLHDEPFLEWRRATRALLQDLHRQGIDRGTVFIETANELSLNSALLWASEFRDTGPLVFARDLGPHRNAAFLKTRPQGAVVYAKPDHDRRLWVLSATPSPWPRLPRARKPPGQRPGKAPWDP